MWGRDRVHRLTHDGECFRYLVPESCQVPYKYPVVLVASLSAGGRGTPATTRLGHVILP